MITLLSRQIAIQLIVFAVAIVRTQSVDVVRIDFLLDGVLPLKNWTGRLLQLTKQRRGRFWSCRGRVRDLSVFVCTVQVGKDVGDTKIGDVQRANEGHFKIMKKIKRIFYNDHPKSIKCFLA